MKIGPTEIIVILVIVILIFGVGKLPQVAGALGKSIRAFKDGQKDADAEELEEGKKKKSSKKKKAAEGEEADKETEKETVDTTGEVVKNDPVENKGPISDDGE
ncbi:MAG: twin-arginine translocase TatA/TatE family subunit [Dehalococcoidales bacterium]|jgi:sec-independent protein translocase protein TatA|nr:twin-arginine translocase TatA/TatE family subunit [Dehalococcoidales bacterium]